MLFLTGGFYSLKYYVYTKINSLLENKISFKDLKLDIFPPTIRLRNVKDFVYKEKNIISFKEVSAEIPLTSIFSSVKPVDITIHHPRVIFDNSLFKREKKEPSKKQFRINKVTIRDGVMAYNPPGIHMELLNFTLKSFPAENTTLYRISSPHLKAVFPFSKEDVTIEGKMEGEFREHSTNWKIGSFYWETKHIKINANGKIYKDGRFELNANTQGSLRQMVDPILGKLGIREFMYTDARIEKGTDKVVRVKGSFEANTFSIGGESFRDMKGYAEWDNQTKGLWIRTGFRDNTANTTVELKKTGKIIHLNATDIPARKLVRIIDIGRSAPLDGIVKKGELEIEGRFFKGKAELAPGRVVDANRFSAAGEIKFSYHSKEKWVYFSSPHLGTEFGHLFSLDGAITPQNRQKISIKVDASINNTAGIDKYTRFYVDLPLTQWKLNSGAGSVKLDVKKIEHAFIIHSDIILENFYSGIEKIQLMKGAVDSKNDITTGNFIIADQNLACETKFHRNNKTDNLTIRFNNVKGEAKKILNILDMDLSAQGPITGNFVFIDKPGLKAPEVKGSFHAKRLNFYDFIFQDLSSRLQYSDTVALKNTKFKYMGGKGTAAVWIDFPNRMYQVQGNVDAIDLHKLNDEFTGKSSVTFNGKGTFLDDPISVSYRTGDINFYKEQAFKILGGGKIYTDFSNFLLDLSGNITDQHAVSPFTFQMNQTEGKYSGKFHVDLSDINLLIPWGDNQGSMKIDGEIISTPEGISTEGHATFEGKVLCFPGFPHVLENYTGDFIFKDLSFTLRSFQGTMGNGNVQSTGVLSIKENRLDELFITFTGTNMTLYPIDRANFTLDADLKFNYAKDRDKLVLSGEMRFLSGIWEREVDESVSFNTNPSLSASGSSIMEMMEFDLKLVGKGKNQVSNGFCQADVDFDLRLTGNPEFPIILGVIESKKGKVNFSTKQFDLIRAKLTFNNKFVNDPLVNVESETYIKNYNITFSLNGPSSRLKPDLQSSPPLPPRDILSLIAVGELFRRPTSTELGSQIGTGTTGLIASEITEVIKKRTKKIFGNYILHLDPSISSVTSNPFEDTSRLIVGKEISKDLLVVYSTNFATQRQEVVYLQYQISPYVSLIGMRNEDGRFSFDIRFRKRQ